MNEQARHTPLMNKTLLVFMAVFIAAMFMFSLSYRILNPSLKVRVAPQVEQPAGDMSRLGELMMRLEKDPHDVDTLATLGRMFMEMKDWDRAAIFWQRILDQDKQNILANYLLGISLFQQEKYREAADRFETVVEVDPTEYRAHYNLGVLYKEFLNKRKLAVEHFQKVITLDHEDQETKAQARSQLEEIK